MVIERDRKVSQTLIGELLWWKNCHCHLHLLTKKILGSAQFLFYFLIDFNLTSFIAHSIVINFYLLFKCFFVYQSNEHNKECRMLHFTRYFFITCHRHSSMDILMHLHVHAHTHDFLFLSIIYSSTHNSLLKWSSKTTL